MAEALKTPIEYHRIKGISFDARRSSFEVNKAAERAFSKALRKVARASGHLVDMHVDGAEIKNQTAMKRALAEYSKAITPWAQRQAFQMTQRINLSNKRAWAAQAKKMGRVFRNEMAEAQTGLVARQLMNEQVGLITSIPVEAGERAQKLAMEAASNGTRANEIAEELERTTDVTESRAMLIARTETARANASINESRATSVGATQYIWRTAEDGDVREAHAEMEGQVCDYNDPPTLSDGTTVNPGEIYNCRCWAEPVLPELEE